MASEAEVEAAAKAMFMRHSSNLNLARTWDELVEMPQHSTTTTHYREHARVALEAAERVRSKVEAETCGLCGKPFDEHPRIAPNTNAVRLCNNSVAVPLMTSPKGFVTPFGLDPLIREDRPE